MINILFFVQPYYIGGAEIQLARIIARLDATRFKAFLAFPDRGKAIGLFKPLLKNDRILVLVKRINDRQRLLTFMKDNSIDLVHNNTVSFFGLAMAARASKIPLIWHLHARLDAIYPRTHYNKIRRVLELIYALSRKIIVPSKFTGEQFYELGLGDKVSIVPNGVSFETAASLKQKRAKGDFVIAMCSRIDPQKKHTEFIKAAFQVRKNFPKAKFIIAGKLEQNNKYAAYLKALNEKYAKPVSFAGSYSYKDIGRILGKIDLLVVPSEGESCPLIILEAMSCGKPVLAVKSGGISEVIKDRLNGFLITAGKAGLLAGAIQLILNDPKKMKSVAEAGHRTVCQKYSIELMLKKLERVYGSCVINP